MFFDFITKIYENMKLTNKNIWKYEIDNYDDVAKCRLATFSVQEIYELYDKYQIDKYFCFKKNKITVGPNRAQEI